MLHIYSFFPRKGNGVFVPVLYQLIQQIELNDVRSVLLAIDKFHVIIPDTEQYAPGLSAISPHVDVYWHKIRSQPITPANNNGSEQIGQTATTIFNHCTQEIVNKYHSDIDPKMKDNSVCLTSLAKVFKHKVTSEQETDVRRHYFLEHFLCHDYVARASEIWCRHLVCRVIQKKS